MPQIKFGLAMSFVCVSFIGAIGVAGAAIPAGGAGAVRVTRTAVPLKITRTPAVAVSANSDPARQAIESYARDELGASVTAVKAGAASLPSLALSTQGKTAVDAAVKFAAQSYGATLTRGAAVVAYGSGSVSGEVSAEMDYGSLGAYVLSVDAAPPADAAQALALVKKTFPAVASMTYTPTTSASGSYSFYAAGSDSAINPKTMKLELVGTAAYAGTTTVRNKVTAWIVLGRGKFTTAITIP